VCSQRAEIPDYNKTVIVPQTKSRETKKRASAPLRLTLNTRALGGLKIPPGKVQCETRVWQFGGLKDRLPPVAET